VNRWEKVGNWHGNYRPGVVQRIRGAIGSCGLDQHRDGEPCADAGEPRVPLAEFQSVVAAAWADRRGLPEPTASMLAAAEAVAAV
jgi:hypothetical protein